MNGYKYFRKDELKRQSGVGFLLCEGLSQAMEIFSGMDDSVVESLWFRIRGETRKCGIVSGFCCY